MNTAENHEVLSHRGLPYIFGGLGWSEDLSLLPDYEKKREEHQARMEERRKTDPAKNYNILLDLDLITLGPHPSMNSLRRHYVLQRKRRKTV